MAHEFNDAKGRPIVAVTGMGLVTSLGRGKADNWAALAAGRSGIRRITRFPTEGMRTTIAGCVDFMDVEPFSAPALTMAMAEAAAQEALAQSGFKDTAVPGPLYVATPPAELRMAPAKSPLRAPDQRRRLRLSEIAGCRAEWCISRHVRNLPVRQRCGASRRALRHPWHAGLGVDGVCIRRNRHPARRGSHSPRRDDNCALRRHRQLRTA